ncbi:MAG: elongation factor P [Phycisphaeraceae bacterium]|nr:elongation factor P [Phycisphaeraceae bacterium]
MKATEIRTGIALDYEGGVWVVVKTEHVKPGKGPAYVQVKMKNAKTGGHIEKRLRSAEEVEQAVIDRRDIEFLYTEPSGDGIFMDMETYDQLTVSKDLLGDDVLYLKPNEHIKGLVYEGQIISIELPSSVEMTITETTPGIKGATVTNQLKDAVCETGLKIKVPAFIKQGEQVRISTENGDYLGRVKEE